MNDKLLGSFIANESVSTVSAPGANKSEDEAEVLFDVIKIQRQEMKTQRIIMAHEYVQLVTMIGLWSVTKDERPLFRDDQRRLSKYIDSPHIHTLLLRSNLKTIVEILYDIRP